MAGAIHRTCASSRTCVPDAARPRPRRDRRAALAATEGPPPSAQGGVV